MTRATGRRLLHDPASRAYGAAPAPVITRSWLHKLGPVLNQGNVNGCTGWTGANLLNAAAALGNRRRFWGQFNNGGKLARGFLGDDQGKYLYALGTRYDSFNWTYPPTDNGGSGLGVAKALKSLGVIDVYRWTFDFDQMLAWSARQPVMLGTVWTDAMSDPDSKGIIRLGSEAQIKSALDAELGHEYLLRGVNWPRKLARIRNQWTPEWGIDGEALIPLDDLHRLVIDLSGDVCVPELVAA